MNGLLDRVDCLVMQNASGKWMEMKLVLLEVQSSSGKLLGLANMASRKNPGSTHFFHCWWEFEDLRLPSWKLGVFFLQTGAKPWATSGLKTMHYEGSKDHKCGVILINIIGGVAALGSVFGQVPCTCLTLFLGLAFLLFFLLRDTTWSILSIRLLQKNSVAW